MKQLCLLTNLLPMPLAVFVYNQPGATPPLPQNLTNIFKKEIP